MRYLLLLALLLALPAWAEAPDQPVLRNLAIQSGGRLKPLDTFAREAVRLVTGKAQFQGQDPLLTVMGWWATPEATAKAEVIEIRNLELKGKLGLKPEQRWFSAHELSENKALQEMAEEIRKTGPDEKLSPQLDLAKDVLVKAAALQRLATGEAWTMVPNPGGLNAEWGSLAALDDPARLGSNPVYDALRQSAVKLREAAAKGDQAGITAAATELQGELPKIGPYPAQADLMRETHYNRFHPFRTAYGLYLFGLLGLLFASSNKSPMYWLGLGLAWFGFAMHAYGFYLRCMIAGRPPVTNMYESVIWVAFGAVLFSLIFELIYRARVYLLASLTGATVCLVLADTLPAVLDPSIRPLTPVLRSNFWLTIHVLTITLGYAAFMLSLGLGHMVIWKYLTGPDKKEEIKGLNKALYKALQVGVLLLAAGTILGGVWANYSWGRFWGWDPKEVWALIALLGYLAILHGRYAGWLGYFGIAACSILAFQGVLMAWYGVNYVLGAGLHSYGFGTGGVKYVACYVLAEVAFVLFATLRYKNARPARPEL